MIELLDDNGMTSDIVSSFTASTLTGYDIAVIAAPCAYTTVYTAAEIAALQGFVSSGGGLLILGDTSYEKYQGVAQAFGFTFGAFMDDELTTSRFETHPVTENVSDVYMYYTAQMTLSGSAHAIVYNNSDLPVAAEALYGSGRVLAFSDSTLWSNSNPHAKEIDQADNRLFALNTFGHLADRTYVPEPATALLLAMASLIGIKKRRR